MVRFRRWVLWLMMAVLPWQGMAVAAMASCGPLPPDAGVLVHHDAHHDGHPDGQRGGHHGGHHGGHDGGAHQMALSDIMLAGDAGDPAGHTTGLAGHLLQHCCGAACALAFAATAAPCHAGQARPPAPLAAEPRLSPGVVPNRLDRPPQA